MRFVVDELPKGPQECPFGKPVRQIGTGNIWYSCNNKTGKCMLDTEEGCPRLVTLTDAMANKQLI